MARRRRGGRRMRRGRRVRRGIPRAILNGRCVRGRQHPQTNSASPWINYTVTFKWTPTATGISCITVNQIDSQIKSEIGLKDEGLILRVYRFDAWVLPVSTATNRNCVVIAPHDFTQGQSCERKQYLNWYEAWGTAVQPAHVHYVWPRSMQVYAMDSKSTAAIVSFDVVNKDISYLVKFSTSWRPEAADPNPKSGIISSARSVMLPPEPPDGFEVLGSPATDLAAVVSQLHT